MTASLIDFPFATVALFFDPDGATTFTLFTVLFAFVFFFAALTGIVFIENTIAPAIVNAINDLTVDLPFI